MNLELTPSVQENGKLPQTGNPVEERFVKTLRAIGILLLVGFFFPTYFDNSLQLANLFLLTEGEGLKVIFYILLLLPFIYGLALIIVPIFVKGKPLSITITAMSLVPFVLLFTKIRNGNVYLMLSPAASSPIDIIGNFWLFAIVICAMYAGLKKPAEIWNGSTGKLLSLAGGVLFFLYLVIPFEFVGDESTIMLKIPFVLFKVKWIITGAVFAITLLLMALFALSMIVAAFSKKFSHYNCNKTSYLIFTAAWIFYVIGIVVGYLIDTSMNNSRYEVINYVSLTLDYVKSNLIVFTFLAMFLVSFSKLLGDYLPVTELPLQPAPDNIEGKEKTE